MLVIHRQVMKIIEDSEVVQEGGDLDQDVAMYTSLKYLQVSLLVL